MNQNKLSKIYAVVALVLIVGVVAGFFWLLLLENQNREFVRQLTDTGGLAMSEVEGPVLSGTEGWKTYRNEKYGFEFGYPNNWYIYQETHLIFVSKEPLRDFQGIEQSSLVINVGPLKKAREFYGPGFDEECRLIESLRGAYQCIPVKNLAGGSTFLFEGPSNLILITDFYNDDISNQILSTFKFIK